MAPTILAGGRVSAVTINGFALFYATIDSVSFGVEANRAHIIRTAATITRMVASVDATGTTRTLQLRKNGANATVVVSPTDTTAGRYSNLTASDAFSTGDTMDLTFTGSAGFTVYSVVAQLIGNAGVTTGIHGTSNSGIGTGGLFASLGSFWNATEAFGQYRVRAPGTYKNMYLSVTSSSAASSTFNSRKNGAAGAMTLTVGAGLTGIFEDTTHTDSLASGDTWGSQGVLTSSMSAAQMGVTVDYTSEHSEIPTGAWIWTASFSNLFNMLQTGMASSSLTTESVMQTNLNLDGSLSNLRMNSVSNTFTGSATISLRKNGVTARNTVTIGAGTTGVFEDTTHVDTFMSGDLLNYIATGGTANTIALFGGITLAPYNQPLMQNDGVNYINDRIVELVGY